MNSLFLFPIILFGIAILCNIKATSDLKKEVKRNLTFPIKIEAKEILNADGTKKLTYKNALFLDTVLIISGSFGVNKPISIELLHVELLKCGYFISYPDLVLVLKMLDEKEGFIGLNKRN